MHMDANPMASPPPTHSALGLALYSFAFRSGTRERHLDDAVRALTEGVAPDRIQATFREIEAELARPVQTLYKLLPGNRRSEQECREFLQLVAQRLCDG